MVAHPGAPDDSSIDNQHRLITMFTELNLNSAFQLFQQLGMTRDLQVRADVTEITWPKLGYRAVLLLSYKTTDRDPALAGGYAIGAEFLFDGLSALEYTRTIKAAKKAHPGSDRVSTNRARMHAFNQLVGTSRCVCIQRDEQILQAIEAIEPAKSLASAEILERVRSAALYDRAAELKTSMGAVDAGAVAAKVRATICEKTCHYTAESIQAAHSQGEHAGWRGLNLNRAS